MLTLNATIVLVLLGLSVICVAGRWIWDRVSASRPESIEDAQTTSEKGLGSWG